MYEMPNFRHLFYFWTIAQEGSIKKASEKLNLTASGMSNQLKELETFLGKSLFDRKVRKLSLNKSGELVFEFCTRIFSQTEEMIQSVRQIRPSRKQLVRVGVLPSLSSTHIHDFVVPLWKSKDVMVRVQEGALDDLVYQLDNGQLEIVLSDRRFDQRFPRILSYRLKPRKIVAVGSLKYEWVRKNFPQSLEDVPMIHLTRHSQIRSEVDRYLIRHEIRPRVIGEADDVVLLRLSAERGVCVAVLPLNTVHETIARGSLIKLGELKGINSDMWAMARKDSSRLGVIKKTIHKFQHGSPKKGAPS